jgi:hypothetical protein
MLKASALYVVIVIALVIAIFCASLISTAYFYRLEFQKNLQYERLLNNLNSGTALMLSINFNQYDSDILMDLPGDETDSIGIRKEKWGAYDVATVHAFTLRDTLKKAFMMADYVNDPLVMYVSDEDRPISISGATKITGDALLPKAGIKKAYVEGRPYSGGKILIRGTIKDSKRTLPDLNSERLTFIEQFLDDSTSSGISHGYSLLNSFFSSAQIIRIKKSNASLGNVTLRGKIIVLCDTILKISRNTNLQDVLVFAPSIVIENGFRGSCQLFARDSIVSGKNSVFNYPSCMGIIKLPDSETQSKVVLGINSFFSGILFSYEKTRSDLQTQVSLGKNSRVKGEIFASGFIKMDKPVSIEGKVSCNRFIIQTQTTLYENYLIDISLNRKALSKYYLSSSLFSGNKPDRRILKWLN